ncbi:MAG: hypothetical protein PHN89_05560 [Candidatus Pacebacteria bacterium]|nr:hypothetical protein [Candidatus Paceibacterota bacterium]
MEKKHKIVQEIFVGIALLKKQKKINFMNPIDQKILENELKLKKSIKEQFLLEFCFAGCPLEHILGTDIAKICDFWFAKLKI